MEDPPKPLEKQNTTNFTWKTRTKDEIRQETVNLTTVNLHNTLTSAVRLMLGRVSECSNRARNASNTNKSSGGFRWNSANT